MIIPKEAIMYPEKIIKINPKRLFIPKILELIVLGIVLYFAIWINFILLYRSMPVSISFVLVLAILIIICIDGILNFMKFEKFRYIIYPDRIEFVTKKTISLPFNEIVSIGYSYDIYDKIFKTGKIRINDQLMEHIDNANTVYFYLQDLIKQRTKRP
ncbi:MAG: hypothetical protein QXG00_05140 [Candidatus Woesearchaeota archaeon]